MTTDFVERRKELNAELRNLGSAEAATMAGFSQLHRAAMGEGDLSAAVKELMALAIAICVHCEGCIAFHVHDALRAGATRPQVEEAIGVAIAMGGGPAVMYGAEAHTALAQFEAAGIRTA